MEGCLYCHDGHAGDEDVNHANLKFACILCDFVAVDFVGEIREHLKGEHQLSSEDLDVETLELVRRNWVRLPRDLRMLQCRLCEYRFLCQSRSRLLGHLDRRHGFRIESQAIFYECRCCLRQYDSGKTFYRHPCVELNSVRCHYCCRNVPENEVASHRSLHTHLDFHCEVNNCTRSFAMLKDAVDHLRACHGKLEGWEGFLSVPSDLRSFTCPSCPEVEVFLCQDKEEHVHDVLNYVCRLCSLQIGFFGNHTCSLKSQKGQVDFSEIDHNDHLDLRTIRCKVCKLELKGCGFSTMAKHLEDIHFKHVKKKVHFENFAILSCLKCKYVAKDVHSWSNHFKDANFGDCDNVQAPKRSRPDSYGATEHLVRHKFILLQSRLNLRFETLDGFLTLFNDQPLIYLSGKTFKKRLEDDEMSNLLETSGWCASIWYASSFG